MKDLEEDLDVQAGLDSMSFDTAGELTAGHSESAVELPMDDIDKELEEEEDN